jgi:hypothetical protein
MKNVCRVLVGETKWLEGRWRVGKNHIRMGSLWLRMWNELNCFMICPLVGFHIGEVESWGSVDMLGKFQGSLEELDIFLSISIRLLFAKFVHIWKSGNKSVTQLPNSRKCFSFSCSFSINENIEH